MFVCMCSEITDVILKMHIAEFKTQKHDPFSREYKSDEEQIFQHLYKTLNAGGKCGNCQILIRQIIRDYLNSNSSNGMRNFDTDSR